MPRKVASFSNETIKRIRALEQKKHRRAEGRFMAEGLRIVTEALDAGHVPEAVVFAEDMAGHALVRRIVAACEAAAGDAIEVPREILARITGKDNPQAVVGVFAIAATPLAELDRNSAAIWTVCQSLKDPGNLGTILRTNDAVGAGGLILLDDSCDPWSVEAVRASMGALFTQAIVQTRWTDFIGWLRAGPGLLVGTSLLTDSDYQSVHYVAPTFVLMGNEQHGLPPDYAAACDMLVKIPMCGRADSLNVAISCAVMLYEVLNQQRR
jgi:TrmH family RNA methyltransferase